MFENECNRININVSTVNVNESDKSEESGVNTRYTINLKPKEYVHLLFDADGK